MFKPKEVEDGTWTGGVTFQDIGYEERLELAIRFLDDDDNGTKKSANLRLIMKILPTLKKKIGEVDLTRLEDNKQYKSFDDLSKDTKAHGVLTQICFAFMESMNLGNE